MSSITTNKSKTSTQFQSRNYLKYVGPNSDKSHRFNFLVETACFTNIYKISMIRDELGTSVSS